MYRRLMSVVAALVVAVTVPSSAAGAPAEPGAAKTLIGRSDLLAAAGLTEDVFALMRVQEKLDVLAERIQTAGRKTPESGFTSVVVDAERNTLTLYWQGALPAPVTAELTAARTTGAGVVVKPAPYSEAQLKAEASRIVKQPLRRGTGTDQRSMSVAPRPDGTGIDVAVGGLPAGTTVDRARALVPALAATGGIPLTVTTGGPQPASRAYDSPPPYWGGSLMQLEGVGHMCTNAFGVTGLNGSATYLLTAAHCGPGQWRTISGITPQILYGTTIATRDFARDGMAILAAPSAGARVYWGGFTDPGAGNPGTSAGLAVGDASGTVIGDRVCTSGALTGTVCDIAVRSIGQIRFDPPVNGVGIMPSMINADHLIAPVAGNGDSGGPVVAVRSDGRASARGIISAITTGAAQRPCPGWQLPNRVCSRSVWFGDIRGVMGTIGVRINTE